MTTLDVQYTDMQFAQFFAFVRQEREEAPLPVQLVKGADNRLRVSGRLTEDVQERLLDIVNRFEEQLRSTMQVEYTPMPTSHKRQIRQRHYRR